MTKFSTMVMRRNDAILPAGMTRMDKGVDPRVYRLARELLAKALMRPWIDQAPFAARRYTFTLLKHAKTDDMAADLDRDGKIKCLFGECKFHWEVEAKGGRLVRKDDGYGEKRSKVFSYPGLELEEEVPQEPGLVYRGMSAEEWNEIQQSGFIRSRGWYNIGKGQKMLTFFGEAGQAQYYASGFTPWPFKPSAEYPGIVVAIPEDLTMTSLQSRHVPAGERAVKGRIPVSEIAQVWAVVPLEIPVVNMEMIWDQKSDVRQIVGLYGNSPSVYAMAIRLS